MRCHENFEIDGQKFVFRIDNGYQIVFIRIVEHVYDGSRGQRNSLWYPGDVETEFFVNEHVGNTKNVFGVFTKIKEILLEWIERYDPPMLLFTTDDPKRLLIYEKMIAKYGQELLKKYYYVKDEATGDFWFYKLNKPLT